MTPVKKPAKRAATATAKRPAKQPAKRPVKRPPQSPAEKPQAELPVTLFKDARTWNEWLNKHAGTSPGVWLRLAKKSAKLKSITYAEALDAALCHGWIDSHKKGYDEESWIQKFTPRGPKSIWSRINRDKALGLVEQGKMRPAGLAAIEVAKANGLWETAYDSHRTATPPDDFLEALGRHPRATAFFATLNATNRYAVLWRIQTARTPETRQKRIDKLVQMLENHEKLHP